MKNRLILNKKYIKIIGISIILLALSLTLVLVKQQQNTRSSAAAPDKLETEAGALTGNAQAQSDSTASGGSYVALGINQTTSPTPPPPPQTGFGPRYSLYGAGSSGNFPAFPTIGGSTVLLPTSANTWSEVEDFINSQPSGTIIVFDSSGGGTRYGSGTEIVINNRIRINNGGGKLKSDVTLWGYNTRIRNTDSSSSSSRASAIFWFEGGGFQNWKVLGFTLEGSNTWAGTYNAFRGDHGHAIEVTTYRGFTIRDNYLHNNIGDGIQIREWDITNSAHYPGWSYPQDLEIGYNRISGTGRQGIVPNQGTNLSIHHNIIEDVGLGVYDAEDTVYGTNRRLKNVDLTDNIFRRWNWYITTTTYFRSLPIAFVQRDSEIDLVDDIYIARNRFEQGARGYGDPDAEALFSHPESRGCEPVIVFGAPWSTGFQAVSNIVIESNVFALDADQSHSNCSSSVGHRGEAVIIRYGQNISIQNNNFQNKPIWLDNSSGTRNISNNGSGTVYGL